MSKTTLDKCSSGWHLFVKRIWQNQTFLSFFPFTSDSEIRQTSKSRPVLQSRYSKKPGSWLNASCVIRFCHIAWMSIPSHFAFPPGSNSLNAIDPVALCTEKILFSALGIQYFVFLTYNLLHKPKWRSIPAEHSILSISLIIIYMWLL